MRFGVQGAGLGCRVQGRGTGFRLRVQGSGLGNRVQGWGTGFGV